jgi:hypothetical protein
VGEGDGPGVKPSELATKVRDLVVAEGLGEALVVGVEWPLGHTQEEANQLGHTGWSVVVRPRSERL